MRRCGLDALFPPAAATGVVGPHCPFCITPGKVSECTNVGRRLEARGKRSGIRGRTERAALQAASEPLWLDDGRTRFDTAVDVPDIIFKAAADAIPPYASMGYIIRIITNYFIYTHKPKKHPHFQHTCLYYHHTLVRKLTWQVGLDSRLRAVPACSPQEARGETLRGLQWPWPCAVMHVP